MTNAEKYKTSAERHSAYALFCESMRSHDLAILHDQFDWLELEYDVVLRSCPFCGSEARLISNSKKDHYAICRNNDCAAAIVARSFSSAKEAITAWNRRVK